MTEAAKKEVPLYIAASTAAYHEQTYRVASWLAQQVEQFGYAWARSRPLVYVTRDLTAAALEVLNRQIAVPKWLLEQVRRHVSHLQCCRTEH